MAIAELTTQRNTVGGAASTSVTFTFPVAPTAGNLVVFGFSWRGDTTVSAVPHSVSLATAMGNGAGLDGAIYYKIASGSEGVTWTFTLAASNKFAGGASEWSGIDPVPLDKTNSNTGSSTTGTTGLTGTLTQAKELVVAVFGNINTYTWSAHDNGSAEIMEAASTGGSAATRNNTSFATKITAATTSLDYGATLSTTNIWSSAVATFKEAPAAFSLNLESTSYAVTGTALTTLRDLLMNAVADSYAISGTALTVERGYVLNLESGAYALSGTALTTLVDRILSADPGSYSITGAALTTLRDLLFNAETGSYSINGTALDLTRGLLLVADTGTYLITGAAAELIQAGAPAAAYTLICDPGTYTITALDAILERGYELNAVAGAYTISGADLIALADRLLSLDPGAYVITGADLAALADRILSLDPGAFAITGSDATLVHGYELIAATGVYLISGTAARAVLELDQFPGWNDNGIRIELITGRVVKILTDKVATLI